MRQWKTALVCGLLCGALCACGGGAGEPFDPETAAQALLETPGVFTETLERLDQDVMLGEYGWEDQDPAEAVCYYSPGGTAEEVTVAAFESEDAAAAFEEAARAHIQDKTEENRDYRPAELPKLDKAVVERRGGTVLVLVCADYDAARSALDS